MRRKQANSCYKKPVAPNVHARLNRDLSNAGAIALTTEIEMEKKKKKMDTEPVGYLLKSGAT